MLYPVLNTNNWLSNAFDDFFNTEWMPRVNATAPAVNVKEDNEKYEMQIAAPGIKKEYCRVSIDKDGNLNVKIENKFEQKEEDKGVQFLLDAVMRYLPSPLDKGTIVGTNPNTGEEEDRCYTFC